MHAGKSFESEMDRELFFSFFKTSCIFCVRNIAFFIFIQSGSAALVYDIISSLHVVMPRPFYLIEFLILPFDDSNQSQ